jgi:hypothetical protein
LFLEKLNPIRRIRELTEELSRTRRERDHARKETERLQRETERLYRRRMLLIVRSEIEWPRFAGAPNDPVVSPATVFARVRNVEATKRQKRMKNELIVETMMISRTE